MTIKETVRASVVSQFVRPRGSWGRLVGWEMAIRRSNRRRNAWAVELLDVRPTDRVLEVGFGPGIAIRELSLRASQGHVHGIDHSEEMVRQATRRNRQGVRAGRVHLHLGSAERLPDLGAPFDRVLAVNNLGMWHDPAACLRELRGIMSSEGRIAIVSQPRCPGATAETTRQAGRDIAERLDQAGFVDTRSETLDLTPPAVCVLGSVAGR